MAKNPVLIIIFLCVSFIGRSQTPGLGTWSVISGKYTLSSRWSLFGEMQVRSQQVVHDFHYHEYKAGVGYQLKNNSSFLLASGHYATYQPLGNFKTPSTTEFRIWEQFTVSNTIHKLTLEHRYRAEQRFISTGYRNRFRYRLNALLPFGNHRIIENNTLYASVYNEVFLSNETPFFEQNRLYGGLGYRCNDLLTITAGVLNRFDNVSSALQVRKNYFQLGFFISME